MSDFGTPTEKWFPWTRSYERDEWLNQLVSRSDHAALEPSVRVTVAELLMWTEIRPLGERRRRQLEAWLDLQPVLPPGRLVSESWARLTARSRQRGRPRPVNDTWIAACCVAYEVPLATLNRADFEDYERHDGLRLLPVR